MTIDDIDLVEINEAFAAQVIPSARHLGIDWDKLNVKGGAIALGHPFGQTGARIMTTLLNALEDTGKTVGLESMCVGGGQGMAMIVERLLDWPAPTGGPDGRPVTTESAPAEAACASDLAQDRDRPRVHPVAIGQVQRHEVARPSTRSKNRASGEWPVGPDLDHVGHHLAEHLGNPIEAARHLRMLVGAAELDRR